MPRVMYKSAEDFLQQQAGRMLSSAQGAPNYATVDGTRIRLEGEQALATLDPAWQQANPARAALSRYREGAPENSIGYQVGKSIRGLAGGLGQGPRPAADSSPSLGAMAGAFKGGIPAALLGLVGGYAADKMSGREDSYWAPRAAAGLGVLGAGLGAYTGYERNKQASYWKGDEESSTPQIVNIINSAPGITGDQRFNLIQGVNRLSDSDSKRLLQILFASGGFGIGAMIAKFLMGAGVGGTILGGVLGGAIGNAFAPRPPKDAFGRNSLGNNDLFGHHLL